MSRSPRLFSSSLLDVQATDIHYHFSNHKSDDSAYPDIKKLKTELRKTLVSKPLPAHFIFACDTHNKIIGYVSFTVGQQKIEINNIFVEYNRENRKEIENELMRLLGCLYVKPYHVFITMTTHATQISHFNFLTEQGFQLRAATTSKDDVTFIKILERPTYQCKL